MYTSQFQSDGIKAKEKNIKFTKEKKNYSKSYKCEECDKKYTWYIGLANHKRFVHTMKRETVVILPK